MAQSIKVTTPGRTIRFSKIVPILLIAIYCSFALITILQPIVIDRKSDDHYFYQAKSWLQGRLDIDNAPSTMIDVVTYNGHRYVPLGNFPAVLAAPLVLIFGDFYRQSFLNYPLVILTALLLWRIVGRLKPASRATQLWLVILFILSTVFFPVAVQSNGGWFTAQIVTVFFVVLGIDEALGKRRPVLLGLYLGMAAASRFTALFTFPFYLWLMATVEPLSQTLDVSKTTNKPFFVELPKLIQRFLVFGVGLAIPLAFYFGLNYLRFGSFLESGYNSAVLSANETLVQARAAGLFSLVHLPKNLYYFLLAVPEPIGNPPAGDLSYSPVLIYPYLRPSPWGMSILLTTPAVVYLVKAKLKQPLVQACWLAILIAAVPILTYYGVGWAQFGFRYALDFTPFIWLLIVVALRRQELNLTKPNLALCLIIAGCLVNLWGAYCYADIRLTAVPQP